MDRGEGYIERERARRGGDEAGNGIYARERRLSVGGSRGVRGWYM